MTERPSQPRQLFHAFSTFVVGGAQVRFATLANRHGALFRHRVFAMDRQYAARDLLDPGVDFTVAETAYEKGRLFHNFRTLRRALSQWRPDVLVTYNWGAIEWGLANLGRSCPHIHIVDGFGPEEADRQLPRRVLFRRFVLSRNTRVVVPSKNLLNIATGVWRLDPGTVRYIPNGIDCARFDIPRDAGLATRIGLPNGALAIGTVAALRPEKNLERLLVAFRKLDGQTEARLVIVGDGAERTALEAKAADLGIADRVIFTGYMSDPSGILSLLDIFAISSDTEQMPISVLEAMATGLPVAGVDVGDVRHIVSDANKDHIVPRDADRLAAVLSVLAGDSTLRRTIGNENRTHVRTVYDEATMVAAYASLFDDQ